MTFDTVPASRVRTCNTAPILPSGACVLYWMTASRRVGWNFALQRAAGWARHLQRPLVILEALRLDYPFASHRLHRFILEGMLDNAQRLSTSPVTYFPFVERDFGEGRDLLETLSRSACLVVTDDWPAFFHPHMLATATSRLPCRLEAVDSNGMLPMWLPEQVFPTAYAFRRYLQKHLPPHLEALPQATPLADPLPTPLPLAPELLQRWPKADLAAMLADASFLSSLPLDPKVKPAPARGGSTAAEAALERFLRAGLPRYAEDRNQPELEVSSNLSPWLHFGHISVHQVFSRLVAQEGWSRASLASSTAGHKEGWWGISSPAESFLDELITWRELGFNFCARRTDHDQFDALPEWARLTLEKHAADPRTPCYSLEDFASARTHDPLWNAAQRQLLQEGRMHNYLRMLWGKKILEWARSPRDALAIMLELNNRYALDGRDPNSSSGILWCLGRYDRPWGPERPVFGTIRYMSSENTARKIQVRGYIRRYSPESTLSLF